MVFAIAPRTKAHQGYHLSPNRRTPRPSINVAVSTSNINQE